MKSFRPIRIVFLLLATSRLLTAATLSLDQTFQPPTFVEARPALRMTLLPDGKFVRYYVVNTLVDQAAGPITRYLPDGTLDNSFQALTGYQSVAAVASVPNGKLIVAALQNTYGTGIEKILRLNPDGSIDPTFAATSVERTSAPLVGGILLQPDGKIIVTGSFEVFADQNKQAIVRLLPDGGLDNSFAFVNLLSSTSGGSPSFLPLNEPALQPDGKLIIYGPFRRIGTTPFPTGIARLNPDGTVDSGFQPGGFTLSTTPRAAVVQADGKILVGGRFTVLANYAANPTHTIFRNLPIVRLNTDGTVDQTYGHFGNPSQSFSIRDLALQGDGKVLGTDQGNVALFASVHRFGTDGKLDSTFTPPTFALRDEPWFIFPLPYLVTVQPDGRILVSGQFTDIDDGSALDDSHYGIARFNSDGTVDPTLTTTHKTGLRTYPSSAARFADGSTVVAFHDNFPLETSVPNNMARLLANGSLDLSYHPFAQASAPLDSAFVADGFSPASQGRLLTYGYDSDGNFIYGRLLPDGAQDPSFFPSLPTDAFTVSYPLPDGRMLVANSDAQSVLSYGSLRVLTTDGHYDGAFIPAAAGQIYRFSDGTLSTIYASSRVLAVQPDGRILFIYLVGDDERFHLVRLKSDGSFDDSFTPVTFECFDLSQSFPVVFDALNPSGPTTLQPPNGAFTATPSISDALVLPDGDIILVGPFASFAGSPANGIVRINSDGSLDSSFQPGSGPQWTQTTADATFFPSIEQVEQRTDGKLLIAGTFEAFNGVASPGLATLNLNGSVDASFVAPALRQRFAPGQATLARQPDGSFLLLGPYSRPNESEATLIHINSTGDIPIVGSPMQATAVPGQPFSYQVVASGQPSAFAVTGLPSGFSFDPTTGLITGDAAGLPAGAYVINITASNSAGTSSSFALQLTISVPAPVISSSLSVSGNVNSPFNYRIMASNQPTSFRANNLPPGLSLDETTGLISGTPQNTGSTELTVRALNAAGSGVASLTITIHPVAPPAFANVSTRLSVGTDGNVLIGGFIITGDAPKKVIIRAIGPSLKAGNQALVGRLEDPVLNLFRAQTVLASNDDWRSSQEQEIIASTVAPTDDREAAIVATLDPGAYTAIVTGKNSTTGIALVEIFDLGIAGTDVFTQSELANISTRGFVQTDNDVMIGGFILTGMTNIIVRAIGPELTPQGVANALQDTTLDLVDSNGVLVAANDDWRSSQEQQIVASHVSPTDDRESAVVATLPPGGYTAVVRGKNRTTGVGLVELYVLP